MAATTEKHGVSRRDSSPEFWISGGSADNGEFGLGSIVSGWSFQSAHVRINDESPCVALGITGWPVLYHTWAVLSLSQKKKNLVGITLLPMKFQQDERSMETHGTP